MEMRGVPEHPTHKNRKKRPTFNTKKYLVQTTCLEKRSVLLV